ncbi:hypothetical protein T484DRAFT_1805073 [Baffinella frigidus]|nr:hypothetical protein T484DRAFT_1805073 [Cryptophyta sp. CCMP2293]
MAHQLHLQVCARVTGHADTEARRSVVTALSWYQVEVYGRPAPHDTGADKHGVQVADASDDRVLAATDKFLVLSNFHASQLPPKARSKAFVTRNAVDAALFSDELVDTTEDTTGDTTAKAARVEDTTTEGARSEDEVVRLEEDGTGEAVRVEDKTVAGEARSNEAHRFVYASMPARGLHAVLQAWPTIRHCVHRGLNRSGTALEGPTIRHCVQYGLNRSAEFRVFYGFTPFDRLTAAQDPAFRGMVGHKELWRSFRRAGFALYPSAFPETSCITLMKAQAAGAVPVTSRSAPPPPT